MDNIQIIFVVETNKQSKTDWIYIKTAIDKYYKVDSHVKLNKIFMAGKGNYALLKIRKEISTKTRQYSAGNENSETIAIFCFDCDDFDVNPATEIFLKKAEKYCKEHNYEFVWFCRDTEHVFWQKQISNSEKVDAARKFKEIDQVDKTKAIFFQENNFKIKRSNLFNIVDKYLERKR